MSKHSSLGASSSHRWMACPGSVNLSEGLERKGSIFADEGTAAHDLGARCLSNNTLNPIVFLDTIIQVEQMEQSVKVDEEMVEAVQVYVDYVRNRQTEDGFELVGLEKQFDLAPLNPPAPMWGRADAVLFLPPRKPQRVKGGISLAKPSILEVVDFKYGQGTVVLPDNNPQGLYYAIGAVLSTKKRADTVRITIVQPRASHPDGIVRSWDCSWDELVEFRKELLTRAVATQQDDAPLHTGDHCQFCPALAICPAQAELAQETAKATFTAIAVVDEELPSVLPAPEALTLSNLQEVMGAAPMITDWLAAVVNHLRDRTEAGEDTGYKLVPKRGRRMWKDEAEVEQVLSDRLGDGAFARKLLSVTQAEKKLKSENAAPIPEDTWAMVSGGTNLVPNNDPRQAIAPLPTAQEVFAPVILIEAEDIHVETEEHTISQEDADMIVDYDAWPPIVLPSGQVAVVHKTEDGLELEVPVPGSKREEEMDVALAETVFVELEDGTREVREVSAEGVVMTPVEEFPPVGMTDAELEGLADQPTHYADAKNFEEPISEGVEITEPIEPELVEYSVTPDEYTPNVEDVQLWQIQPPAGAAFYVQASNAAEAKAMAREELKVERLPNHTKVSLS